MTRYTVIGAGGFVGARLAATLRASGAEVFAPGRDDPQLFTEDLGRLVYCAGLTADYLARPFDTVEAHVALLAKVLREARFDRLVYLSSTRLYDWMGPDAGREDEPLSLTPAEPRHLYDLSKALGENLTLTQSGGRGAVARLACVWDWRDGAPGFLPQWLQQARRNRTLSLDSSTGYVRDYIHLDDTVAGLRAMADAHDQSIVNLASGENVSNGELAEVFETAGWRVTLARSAPKQAAPLCAVDRLRKLGVEPVKVREAIAALLKAEAFRAAGHQTRQGLIDYTCAQVANLIPDGKPEPLRSQVAANVDEALARVGHCIDQVAMWRPGAFNYLHSSQYCIYLYYLANSIWNNGRESGACTRLFLLNKALNGIDLFYEIEMPSVFFIGHSVGIVLAKATYGEKLVLYQNSTVGKNHGVAPTLGEGVVMYPNTAIIGRCTVGDRTVLSQGTSLVNQDTPGDCIAFAGPAGRPVFKKAPRDVLADIFR